MKLSWLSKALIALLVLTVLFIYSNSMPDQETSRNISLSVKKLIEPFLELFVGEGKVTDQLVRKLAHFIEFGLLGVLAATYVTVTRRGDPIKRHLIAVILLLVVAASDEFLQRFTERGAQVSDVVLDFAGAMTGFIAVKLIAVAVAYIKKRKTQK